jgi:hypothetical protein
MFAVPWSCRSLGQPAGRFHETASAAPTFPDTKEDHIMIRTVFSLVLALAAGAGIAEEAKPEIKPYPLDTCVVSGEKLGEMGEPVTIVHEGREVKFCCAGCIKKFKKDPAKFLGQMDEKAKAAETGKEAKPVDGAEHKH